MTSILDTQKAVNHHQAELRRLEIIIAHRKERLAKAIAKHRAQIAKSLASSNTTERVMAESIAEWWEVTTDRRQDDCPAGS